MMKRMEYSRQCHSYCLSYFFVLIILAPILSHASSNINYNVYNYDMTTPQFTPDGRLLQVEYACTAADLSAPLVALHLPSNNTVLMTLRASNTQNRMVLFDDKCIAMSGVLSDSVALLQVVLKEASEHLRRFKKPLTLLQAANSIADACQKHAFGGGIRPFGSTMLVCGYNQGDSVVYQTDPSGAILQAPPITDTSSPAIRWMVGGNPTLQRQLRKRIESNLSRAQKRTDNSSNVANTLAIVARTLIKETQKNNKLSTKALEEDKPILEIVILSPTLGCHRLSKDQLLAIVQK